MNIFPARIFLLAMIATILPATPAYAFRADASVTVTACSAPSSVTDGGMGSSFASASSEQMGVCGPTPEDDATAIASAVADIAARSSVATADAQGVVGGNRATGNGSFSDTLFINADPGVDTVEIRASIDVTANATGTFDFSQDFLFARVTISSVGQIEIRQCTPVFCPTSPPMTESLSQTFVVPRGMFSGEFPTILVSTQAIIDLANGSGVYAATVNVEVIDDSGAQLTSESGVFGTGGGTDSDGDGINDDTDNCTIAANADQRDTDGDGHGNVCDADLNNDCVVNSTDLGLFRAVFFSADPDGDLNGDGVVNATDLGLFRALFFAPPGPSAMGLCSARRMYLPGAWEDGTNSISF